MPGKMPRPSGAWQMPSSTRWWAGMWVMSWPSNQTLPAGHRAGRRRCVFSVVVLPAPLAPMSVTISPSSTVNERPLMAWMRP